MTQCIKTGRDVSEREKRERESETRRMTERDREGRERQRGAERDRETEVTTLLFRQPCGCPCLFRLLCVPERHGMDTGAVLCHHHDCIQERES